MGQRAKLEKNLGSISEMTRLPGALFVVDIKREHIAIKEAQKLKIPIFAMVDTNSDPRDVNFVIPANDDASKSIDKILTLVTEAVGNGLQERQSEKDAASKGQEEASKVEATPVEKAAPVDEAAPKAEATPIEKAAPVEETAPKAEAAPVEETAPKAEAASVEKAASKAKPKKSVAKTSTKKGDKAPDETES